MFKVNTMYVYIPTVSHLSQINPSHSYLFKPSSLIISEIENIFRVSIREIVKREIVKRVIVFPRNFEFLANFHINSIETQKKCFLFCLLNRLLNTKRDVCIEFNHIYLNINLNLYFRVKSNYKIQSF